MTKDKESPYFTKLHPIYGITLYSIDGNTWSTNPSELPVIQDRLEKGLVGSIDKRMIPPRKRPAGGSTASEGAPNPVLAEGEDEDVLEEADDSFDEADEEGEGTSRTSPTSSRTKRIGDALRSLGDELGLNDDDDDDKRTPKVVKSAPANQEEKIKGRVTKLEAGAAKGSKATKPSQKVVVPISARVSQRKATQEKVTPLPLTKKIKALPSKTTIASKKTEIATKKAPIAAAGSKAKSAPLKRVAESKLTKKTTKSAPTKTAPAKAATKGAKTTAPSAKRTVPRTLKASSASTKGEKSQKTTPQKKGATKTSPAKKASAPSRSSKRK
jgi:hypothetical protein